MMCSYLAVLYIPLGDAMTLIYAGPIFTMTFAFLFLRIRQGPWKIFFALVLVLGVILVVRPPFIFPNDNLCNDTNGNHTVKRVFYSEKNDFKKDNHFWIGVALALGAACIGGLINVSICYLKVI